MMRVTKRKVCVSFAMLLLTLASAVTGRTIYVDDDGPADFNNIQAAIDNSDDGDIVITKPGRYTGPGNCDIDFKGRAITVRSQNGPENCIIDCQKTGRGFFFHSGEDANSIIDGFTITNSWWSGISCRGSSPTISNCNMSNCSGYQGGGIECRDNSYPAINNCIITRCIAGWGGGIAFYKSNAVVNNCLIVGNEGWDATGGIYCVDSILTVTNCTISDNMSMSNYYGVILCSRSSLTITNCILWGNSPGQISDRFNDSVISVNYSDIEGSWQGEANIDVDPCFVRPGYWGDVNDPNIVVEPNDANAIWVDGDYHLKSQAGRWDPNSQRWVKDDVTSSCIDAGDPTSDWTGELWPHGMRINMGAYGGTPEASMSLLDAGNIADLNTDEIVDFRDFANFTNSWHSQRVLLPDDLDRNGMVDFNDIVIFAEHWLTTAEIILLPGRASNPYPADSATNVNINVVLSWTPGAGATLHDIYFGMQSPGTFQRNQTEITFVPGTLRSRTKYYWRIDEVNSDGKTTGTVWSFTTGGKVVCFPTETLVWVDGILVQISTVSPNQRVGKFYDITPMHSSKEIEKVEEHQGVFNCYDIILESGECISAADNHYFLLDSDLWVSVQELTRGSRLQSFNGPIAIRSVVKRATLLVGKVYNLKIKNSDRYFVGSDGVVVRDY